MTEENEQLRIEIEKKDFESADVKESTAVNVKAADKNKELSSKIAEKNKELKQLKTQISTLEDQVGTEKITNENCKRELDVKTAELQREKEINDLLTRKQEKITAKKRRSTEELEAKKKSRGACFHEVLKQNSCPFIKCMFSHDVTDDIRNDPSKISEAKKKKASTATRNTQNSIRTEPQPRQEICENAFRSGSCDVPQCDKFHNLQFDRIKRGICHLHVLGLCNRQRKRWFTHEIPSSVKRNNDTIKAAKEFLETRKERHAATSKDSHYQNRRCSADISDTEAPRDGDVRGGTTINATPPTHRGEILHSNKAVQDQCKPMQSQKTNESESNSVQNNHQGPSMHQRSNSDQQQKPVPTLPIPSHDSFLFLIRTTIQDQIRQMFQMPPCPQFYPTRPLQYPMTA